ncbi:hypothetical protein BABINDRAFT_172053 [Babjeviella inositovora NRRL Y-12698]|uniref:JmjC domain-containing protein n=1 Tax=Babjeviella inositovora NRRL Y-12698 TaxID=984486 RepID=A0A1E3QP12_9ASCO|nr:uncharacterized protein BABINDRAFT_172053 [Babjeviella inositovora NRRL Y-12698]ODQ78717.1 hypothetical protein BABINDRAFT_172053 [Babjeviella inositovora NRRL Y-12698]
MTFSPPTKKQKVFGIKRSVPRHTVTPRHPLNIRPSGNSLLLDSKTTAQCVDFRRAQLGHLSGFPDELIVDFLSYFDNPKDLLALSHVSKLMYCYTYDEELWRKLYIKKALQEEKEHLEQGLMAPKLPLGIQHWKGSWKKTLLDLPSYVKHEQVFQVPDNLFFSDTLFRSFQCSTIDYDTVLRNILAEEEHSHRAGKNTNDRGRIPRLSEAYMNSDAYNAEWVTKPFILTKADARWPEWTLATLVERFPDVQFRQEAVKWPLSFYSEYFRENHDESPLYLFDCQSPAMTELIQEYRVPECFQYDLFTVFDEIDGDKANKNLSDASETSTFALKCRPDHAWLIVGPARSGSTFHKDPNHTSAWNTTLSGRKLWVMLPPEFAPPGVGTDTDESEVTSPVGIAEWFIGGFFQDTIKISNDSGNCLIGVTYPGECIHVPAGWWHSVINIDDCVALTHNFVPRPLLGKVFNFLKNKNHQISGFRPADVKAKLERVLQRYAGEEGKESPLGLRLVQFRRYLEATEQTQTVGHLEEEDCGETLMNGQCLLMPVFEMFEQLLLDTSNEAFAKDMGLTLAAAYESLGELEAVEMKKKLASREIVRSKMWDELTASKLGVEQAPAFSFGFEESDEE